MEMKALSSAFTAIIMRTLLICSLNMIIVSINIKYAALSLSSLPQIKVIESNSN